MKATYKNSIRSKQLIRKAFVELLNEKGNMSAINVTDIVSLAGINRGTFYNHYNNVFDISYEIENEILDKLSSSIKDSLIGRNIESYIYYILGFFKENENVYRTLIKCVSQNVIDNLKTRFISVLDETNLNLDKIKVYFIVNALSGLYFDYLQNHITLSLDEIAKRSIAIVKTIIR